MKIETKGLIAILLLVVGFFLLGVTHWYGFFNPNRPRIATGVCVVMDEEFPDMRSVRRIERVGKTQVQWSFVCSYEKTKNLYATDISLVRRFYKEVPCECKEE